MPIVPFKLNQERRHHIPRQKRTITNWPAYDASLRQRGSLTVWFTDAARRVGRRAPYDPRRAALVFGPGDPDGPNAPGRVPMALTLRAVFRWP